MDKIIYVGSVVMGRHSSDDWVQSRVVRANPGGAGITTVSIMTEFAPSGVSAHEFCLAGAVELAIPAITAISFLRLGCDWFELSEIKAALAGQVIT